MNSRARVQAQSIVVLGFVLSAAAAVISYLNTVTQRGYHFNGFRVVVLPMLNPLLTIAAVFAWWWLTRVEIGDEGQRRNLHRALIAFAVQYMLLACLYALILFPLQSLGDFWMTTSFWSDLVGAFVSSLGLVLLSLTFRSRATVESAISESGALV